MRDDALILYSFPRSEFERMIDYLETFLQLYTAASIMILAFALILIVWLCIAESIQSRSGKRGLTSRRKVTKTNDEIASSYDRLTLEQSST